MSSAEERLRITHVESGLDGGYWQLPSIIDGGKASRQRKKPHSFSEESVRPESNVSVSSGIGNSGSRNNSRKKKHSQTHRRHGYSQKLIGTASFKRITLSSSSSSSSLFVSLKKFAWTPQLEQQERERRLLLERKREQEREERLRKLADLQRRVEEDAKGKEVLQNLFLGNKNAARNKEWLLTNNVKYILNVTKEVKNFFEHSQEGFLYKK